MTWPYGWVNIFLEGDARPVIIVGNWGWPQWTLVVLALLSLVFGIGKHGEIEHHENSIGIILFAEAVIVAILAFGGFFHQLKWPQIIWIMIQVISTGILIRNRGYAYFVSFWRDFLGIAVNFVLYAFGGFFA